MKRLLVFLFILLLNFSSGYFSEAHAAKSPDFFSMKSSGLDFDEAEPGPAVSSPSKASDGGVGWNSRPGAGEGAEADESAGPDGKAKEKILPGGHMKMSGQFRLAAGVGRDFVLNDSNQSMQEWDFRYMFGEDLNNTFDRAVYSQYRLNVDLAPTDHVNFYTEIVADPWSYVGTTGEQTQPSDITGTETIRYNLKYWGANNSTINEIWRMNTGDATAFPVIKTHEGHLSGQTLIHGFYDFNPGTGGIPFTIPELDIDTEFRPIRKFWMDYTQENWHVRIFPIADQAAALTSDDPLNISNHKAYWQQSPWLYEYKPIQYFTDGSLKRGYFSDALSFLARDSASNFLVGLRGISVEADLDSTYIAATVAAPFSPWDQDYFSSTSVPAAIRLKHEISDSLTVGTVHTFRAGLIDDSVADTNQVHGVDLKFDPNENWTITGEAAGSVREQDKLTNERIRKDTEGFAGQAAVETRYERPAIDGEGNIKVSYTQMDSDFSPGLARYTNTKYDPTWAQHLTFTAVNPDIEPFRIGDGIDVNRKVIRAQWKEKMYKEKFTNLFDIRQVEKEREGTRVETVLRDEVTYHVTDRMTAKGMFRWRGLPQSRTGVEPLLTNFYFPTDSLDLSIQEIANVAVPAGKDPSTFTYAGALQYVFNSRWTAEGFAEVTNAVPDFPRGLLNATFRDSNDRIDGILLDHITTTMYGQGPFGGIPPYEFFTITRQRVIYKPQESLKFIFHAAQNGYKFASGIDENVNHQGLSIDFQYNKKLNFFLDYTHSIVMDAPRLIASGYTESRFNDHHNVYGSMDYHINSALLFRAEYGVLNLGTNAPLVSPFSVVDFQLKTLDTEHFLRLSLNGEF